MTEDSTKTREAVRTATEATRAPPGTVVARIAENEIGDEAAADADFAESQRHIAAGKRTKVIQIRLGLLAGDLAGVAGICEQEGYPAMAGRLRAYEQRLHALIKFAETGEGG